MDTAHANRPRPAVLMRTRAGAVTLWRFSRPHTITGTVLAVCVLYLLAVHATGRQDPLLLLTALVASVAVNVYIVGLNQLTDVPIDRINKPELPLAAGTMGRRTAVALAGGSGALALGLAAGSASPYLFGTIATVFLVGTAYSLPPVRLKRYPVPAAASIITARAVVATLGGYLTYITRLAGRPHLPGLILLFAAVLFAFTVVIAVMKDVPDAEGDRAHRIGTVALRLGPERSVRLCRTVLTACYLGAATAGALHIAGADPHVLITAHLCALLLLWARTSRLRLTDRGEVRRYYLFVWGLFYLEFAVFLLAGVLPRPVSPR